MSNQQVEETLMKADRWSKMIALFFAMGMFGLASVLTTNPQVNATIAAFSAVGVRIYIPYHVSVFGGNGDGISSQSYEMTGNYHHGAAGAALVAGPFAALAVFAAESMVYGSIGVAIAVGAVVFLVLRKVLPA